MGKGFGQKRQFFDAGHVAPHIDIDGSFRHQEFIGGHAGIADNDQPGFRVHPGKFFHLHGLSRPGWILPEGVVNRIVKKESLKILELVPGVVKEGVYHVNIGFHGPPPVVNGKDDF